MNASVSNATTAFSLGKGVALNSAEQLEAALRHIGETRYHNLHPFHRLLHGGELNKGQVQAWALNRYYYQSTIPIKDAVVISRFRDRGTRLEWRHRIEDHDGNIGSEGGIERWLKLTEGLGLDSAYVESTEGILPATRFAVEAYVHFCRDKTPLEAVASSLTELFAPNLHEERISGMLAHYDFVNPDIMSYFSRRLQQAPRDAGFALQYVKEHAKTPAQREAPDCRIVYADNDPVVLTHARALLRGTPVGSLAYLDADLRYPDMILAEAAKTLDLKQPVAIMLLTVLQFVPDDEAYEVVERLTAACAPGSYLVISHPASDIEADRHNEMVRRMNESMPQKVTLRDHAGITRMFDGLKLVEPGVVKASQWRPESDDQAATPTVLWAGVACKP